MKNKFEKRGDHYAIFANGQGMRHEILVDEADFKTVDAFPGTWFACKSENTFHARIFFKDENNKRTNVKMHRVLLSPHPNQQVKHRDSNCLDNRRQNIFIVEE